MRSRAFVTSAFAILAFVSLTAEAATVPYRFDAVAQTGAQFSSFAMPSLNDLGTVAFDSSDGVFVGTPAGISRLATPGLSGAASPYINNLNQVVFTAPAEKKPGLVGNRLGVYIANPTGSIVTIL